MTSEEIARIKKNALRSLVSPKNTIRLVDRILELEAALSEFCKAWDGIVMDYDGMTTASSDNLEAARELAGDVLAKGEA